MKKLLALLIAILTALSMVACGANKEPIKNDSSETLSNISFERKDNWISLSMSKEDALEMTDSQFEELVKTYIENEDYLFGILFFDDGTGVKFTSSSMGTYGKIDEDGVLSTIEGYVYNNFDGTYTYESATDKEQLGECKSVESKYNITIDGFSLCKNFENEDSVIIDYTFINNSNQTACFDLSINDQVFQNDTLLSPTLLNECENYNSENSLKEIEPNESISCQNAYLLNDMSTISVKPKELLSSNEQIITQKDFSLK